MLATLEHPPSQNSVVGFDNRFKRAYQIAGFHLLNRTVCRERILPHHYWLDVAGKRIIYCYIRKNACTAFKEMFRQESPYKSERDKFPRKIDFMDTYHAVKMGDDLTRVDAVIFVHRDPIERIVSLYANKFIARSGNADIFGRYRRETGKNPEDASFRDFCHYIKDTPWQKVDPHCTSQMRHLAPIWYTHAIDMTSLHDVMSELLGADIGNRYFRARINHTEVGDVVGGCEDMPSRDLYEQFIQKGTTPAYREFLKDDEILWLLGKIYADDVAFRLSHVNNTSGI